MKNNKVAILTYSNTTNYGAILQAYSLKKFIIDNCGFECDILNYFCDSIKEREKTFFYKERLNFKSIIKRIILFPIRKYRKIKIYNFCKKNEIYTKKKYNKENIVSTQNEYDIFIVGSDQVWNIDLNGNDSTFFLSWLDSNYKKIAYAASVGNDNILIKNKIYYINNIKQINYVSLREKTTCQLLNKYNINSTFVLDPTFLISKEVWFRLIKEKCALKEYNHKRKYLLLYFIHNGSKTFNVARRIAKQYGLNIIYLNNYGIPIYGVKNIFSVTPFEFLKYIYEAELIITGSFHGIAFSLNFNKNFLFEKSEQINNVNTRIDNLIKLFDLKNDIFTYKIDRDNYQEMIDYSKINVIIENNRKKSIEFLMRGLR